MWRLGIICVDFSGLGVNGKIYVVRSSKFQRECFAPRRVESKRQCQNHAEGEPSARGCEALSLFNFNYNRMPQCEDLKQFFLISNDSAHQRRKNMNFPKKMTQTMIFRQTRIETNHETQRDGDLPKYEGLS